MVSAVIVDALRTPVGRRGGGLRDWHPVDLAGHVLAALVERCDLDPGVVDDVVLGCTTQTGEQSLNVARQAALAAGLPESVPGVSVDRQCASSQQAVHFAAQGVMAGAYDVVIAGGVESTSRVPTGSAIIKGRGWPFGPRVQQRYHAAGGLVPQGVAAERLAERYGLSRQDLDCYSVESHRRAASAVRDGSFRAEVVPVAVESEAGKEELADDEEIRSDCDAEALGRLKPSFVPGGRITAGNAAPPADGAAAALVASERVAARLGLTPRARVVAMAVAGVDPVAMLTGAVPASALALERAGVGLGQVDLVEVDETYAAVVLAWAADQGAHLGKINVSGGAIALGHPPGAAGARALATLVHGLERRRGRLGLLASAAAGGTGAAMIVERLR